MFSLHPGTVISIAVNTWLGVFPDPPPPPCCGGFDKGTANAYSQRVIVPLPSAITPAQALSGGLCRAAAAEEGNPVRRRGPPPRTEPPHRSASSSWLAPSDAAWELSTALVDRVRWLSEPKTDSVDSLAASNGCGGLAAVGGGADAGACRSIRPTQEHEITITRLFQRSADGCDRRETKEVGAWGTAPAPALRGRRRCTRRGRPPRRRWRRRAGESRALRPPAASNSRGSSPAREDSEGAFSALLLECGQKLRNNSCGRRKQQGAREASKQPGPRAEGFIIDEAMLSVLRSRSRSALSRPHVQMLSVEPCRGARRGAAEAAAFRLSSTGRRLVVPYLNETRGRQTACIPYVKVQLRLCEIRTGCAFCTRSRSWKNSSLSIICASLRTRYTDTRTHKMVGRTKLSGKRFDWRSSRYIWISQARDLPRWDHIEEGRV